MSTNVLGVISTHQEAVRPKLHALYETSSQVSGLIKDKGETTKVSRYLYRIPIELYPGGAFAKYSANGGALGEGHHMNTSHLTAAYFYSSLAFSMTQESKGVTAGNPQAIINLYNEELSRAIGTAQVHEDITLHTDGSGVLTNGASASADTTHATFAGASDTWGVNNLREGMSVNFWNAGLTTIRTTSRTNNSAIITNIDYSTKEITLDTAVTGLVATDVVTLVGMATYGPTGPTSFSSTFPEAPASQVAAGIGGDSFRHGLYYVNDNTPANYFLGRQKSTISQLLPNRIVTGKQELQGRCWRS